jgi:NAD(P)H-quinone oxidoreductase subunit 5
VPPTFAVPLALVAAVAMALLVLFAMQAAVTLRPSWSVVRRLYPWAYGGFYLDERVSRAMLARWSVPDAPTPAQPLSPSLAGAR